MDWSKVTRSKYPLVRTYRRKDRNNRLQVEYFDPREGRVIRRMLDTLGFKSERECRQWLQRLSGELQALKGQNKRRDAKEIAARTLLRTPLSTALEEYEESYKVDASKTSLASVQQKLVPFHEWLRKRGKSYADGESLTSEALARFRDSLPKRKRRAQAKGGRRGERVKSDKPLSRYTLNGFLSATQAALNWCRIRGYVSLTGEEISSALPKFKTERKRPIVLSTSELNRLLQAAIAHDEETYFASREDRSCYDRGTPSSSAARRFQPLFPLATLLALTGLRSKEARYLKWRDIDFENDRLWVCSDPDNDHHLKTGQVRHIELDDSPALKRLLATLHMQRGADEYVLGGEKPASLDRRAWYRLCDIAEVDRRRATPHTLRRGFATAYALSNHGTFEHCARLGHGPTVAARFYIGSAKPLPGNYVEDWLGVSKEVNRGIDALSAGSQNRRSNSA